MRRADHAVPQLFNLEGILALDQRAENGHALGGSRLPGPGAALAPAGDAGVGFNLDQQPAGRAENRGDFGDLHIATSLVSRRFNGFGISAGVQKAAGGQAHGAQRRALQKILAGNVAHLILPFSI